MRVEYATIYDINKFTLQFKKQFERRTGKSPVKNVEILHYKTNNEKHTHQVDINVTFRTPLSYCYLNDIAFPTNWTFSSEQ